MNENEEMKQFEEYERDADWFQEHFDELAEKYVGCVLAVKNRKILATNEDIDVLIRELRTKGENPAVLFIGSILPGDEIIIL
ncbi:MAG: hypothetical protein KAT49_04560 [Methanomicrobia archaeon]|nr:hypothetical protein [Methanomicrobia archaeon]